MIFDLVVSLVIVVIVCFIMFLTLSGLKKPPVIEKQKCDGCEHCTCGD